MHTTRHLAGTTECICRNCAPSGSAWRKFVKRDVRRFIRHGERGEIAKQMQDDTNEWCDYLASTLRVNAENIRNMRR